MVHLHIGIISMSLLGVIIILLSYYSFFLDGLIARPYNTHAVLVYTIFFFFFFRKPPPMSRKDNEDTLNTHFLIFLHNLLTYILFT